MAVIICAVFTVVHTLIAFLVPAAFPIVRKLPTAARADLMMQIMWLIGCTPLPFMYAFAIPDLIATPELRWQGHSWLVEWALMLHVGSSFYEAVVFWYYGKSWVFQLHHVVVVYAYGIGLYCGRMHFWGAWDGLVEFTNFNVCILKTLVILNVGRGSLGEAINGGTLYLVYLVVRVLSLPMVLALFAHDLMYHGETNVAEADLERFLAVAEDLEVRGLTGGETTEGPDQSRRDQDVDLDDPQDLEWVA